jgi:hypothetical protein
VRTLLAAIAVVVLGGAGCTETPDWFPPCVYTAPCPDADGGDGEAFDSGPSDALDEAADAPDTDAMGNGP